LGINRENDDHSRIHNRDVRQQITVLIVIETRQIAPGSPEAGPAIGEKAIHDEGAEDYDRVHTTD
jgi:hypothetical protein